MIDLKKNVSFCKKEYTVFNLLSGFMMKSKFLIWMVFVPTLLSAQIDTLKLNAALLDKGWTDTKRAFAAPFHWEKQDWTTFGVVTVTTAALFLVDDPIDDAFQSWNEQWGESGSDFSTNYLEPWGTKYSFAVIGGLMGYGLLAKNQKSQSTALLAAESMLLASLITRVPKVLFGRARPDSDPDVSPYKIEGPFHGSSLPSGHTTAVFAVASVIANQYSDRWAVPVVAYTVAGATGLSRMYDKKHWLSDVFAGAAIGITVGNMVSAKQKKKSQIVIVPFSSGHFQGVKFAYIL